MGKENKPNEKAVYIQRLLNMRSKIDKLMQYRLILTENDLSTKENLVSNIEFQELETRTGDSTNEPMPFQIEEFDRDLLSGLDSKNMYKLNKVMR